MARRPTAAALPPGGRPLVVIDEHIYNSPLDDNSFKYGKTASQMRASPGGQQCTVGCACWDSKQRVPVSRLDMTFATARATPARSVASGMSPCSSGDGSTCNPPARGTPAARGDSRAGLQRERPTLPARITNSIQSQTTSHPHAGARLCVCRQTAAEQKNARDDCIIESPHQRQVVKARHQLLP